MSNYKELDIIMPRDRSPRDRTRGRGRGRGRAQPQSRKSGLPNNQPKKQKQKPRLRGTNVVNVPYTTGRKVKSGVVVLKDLIRVTFIAGDYNYNIPQSFVQVSNHPMFNNGNLSSIVTNFQKWECISFKMTWVPMCSVVTNGAILATVRTDCNPLTGDGPRTAILNSLFEAHPIWQMFSINFPKSPSVSMIPSVKENIPATGYFLSTTDDIDLRTLGMTVFEAAYRTYDSLNRTDSTGTAEQINLSISVDGIKRTNDFPFTARAFCGLVIRTTISNIDIGELIICTALPNLNTNVTSAVLTHNGTAIDYKSEKDQGTLTLNAIDLL